ncbi:glycosyltransferase family 2 protein [Kineococcus sp. LSe6-4]|uniref:4,4'-diaponeurosporenoate glycosyltransferase n=1 Tax=Kineococcus halophytocola TaxID=3234027 RepID=A0ABV4H3G9_9ACTN
MRLERIVVVVPARDEAATVTACVASVRAAARCAQAPVDVLVVADRCTDATAALARAAGARVLTTSVGAVGAARAAGVDAALAGVPPERWPRWWIAGTDADSVVPHGWLRHQERAAAAGTDLLLGTVDLPGPATRHAAWRARYAAGRGHVHGANLGIRASVYRAAGGFPAVPAHEDRELAERVRALPGARVTHSDRFPVLTSDRTLGRAPEGVARDLQLSSPVSASLTFVTTFCAPCP